MEYARLTQHADAAIDGRSRVPSWRTLRDEAQHWWQLTSSKLFLSSPNSRRDTRVVLLALTYCGGLVSSLDAPSVDFVPTCGLGAAIALLLCIGSCVPTDTLWSDALYTLLAFIFTIGWTVLNPSIDPQTFGPVAFHLMVGVHSVYNATFLAATSIVLVFVAPERLWGSAYSCVVLCFHFVVENRCARQCADLDLQYQARQYLLDGASQGWCDVSTADGIIKSTSSELPAILGLSSLAGQRLAGFVRGADAQRIDELCLLAEGSGRLTPFLVTCQTTSNEFDAKIIPYAKSPGIVKVCIQVQGERRFNHTQVHSDPTEGGDDASEFALSADSITQPSAFQPSVPSCVSITDRATQTDTLNITDRAMQTDIIPQQRQPMALQARFPAMQGRPPAMQGRPVELPHWMSARLDGSGSESDAASERSVSSGSRRRRRRTGRPLITFTNQPLVPEFSMTPADCLENSVNWFVAHWNIPKPKPRNMCCEYHAAYQCLSLLTRKKMTSPCQPAWRTNSGWQCPRCFLMHDHTNDDCDACREDAVQPSSDDSSPSPDPSDGPARRVSL